MQLSDKLILELQKRLKIGNRRGVHLNAIPSHSKYKFDLNRLSLIDENLPNNFIKDLLSQQPLKFKISGKESASDINTLFEEEQLQLVKISKAFENLVNQTEAIESEKGINTFGFGFPILVRRDKADNKLTVAPILIWSLRIKRTREAQTWEILRNDEDPIYINEVLINHLQSDAQVTIDPIPNEMLEDGLINNDELLDICTSILKTVNASVTDDLREILQQKLQNVTSIGSKNNYESLPLTHANSLIDFSGLFSIFEVQKQNIISDFDELLKLKNQEISLEDLENNTFQSISSVETDPSQQSILHALENKRNLLIQGPPGTGKSQTLTAVLINALENNKKTIVVCEKRTALEVLYNALVEKGLQNNCVLIRDLIKDRKTVVDSVRDRIDMPEFRRLGSKASKDALANTINKAKSLIESINKKHQKVGKELLGSDNWTQIVGKFLQASKNSPSLPKLDIDKSIFEFSPNELNAKLDLVQNGHRLFAAYEPISANNFLNSNKMFGENQFLVKQNLNDDFDQYASALQRIKSLLEDNRNEYHILRNTEFSNLSLLIDEIINGIISHENQLYTGIESARQNYTQSRENEYREQNSKTQQYIASIERILDENRNNNDLKDEDKINGFGYKMFSIFSKDKKQTIADHQTLVELFNALQNTLNSSKDLPIKDFRGTLLDKHTDLIALKSELESTKNNFSYQIDTEFNAFKLNTILDGKESQNVYQAFDQSIQNNQNSAAFKEILISMKKQFQMIQTDVSTDLANLRNHLHNHKDLQLNYSFDRAFEENKILFTEIKQRINLIKNELDNQLDEEFKEINLLETDDSEMRLKSLALLQNEVKSLNQKISEDQWIAEKISTSTLPQFIEETEKLLAKKDFYFNAEHDNFNIEFSWFQFYNALNSDDKSILDALQQSQNWRKDFLMYYLNALLLSSANMDLPTNDNDHLELKSTLKGIGNEQLKYVKDFWNSQQVEKTKDFELNNRNLSVENLYNKRSSVKFKRLSLRQIVQYDVELFTNFFPIILTSPDVASNLFKGMNGYFDIVMFDEASQLRLEDNLPAILKGKQVIIAGDEHQMPPSNYFSKVFDGEIEDEEEVEEEKIVVDKENLLLSCESLLEFGSELRFEKQYLDFHYRSKHPYLIDFSNYAFYNQRLKPLPAHFQYTPISYVQVNGTFSDYTNEAEAEKILSIIENSIQRLPNGEYPSVGVATFNITQRNLIKSKILDRQKYPEFDAFNKKIQELEGKGFFIKNLENIQGDERDVIILSTTYGVSKDRKFSQRFGPINHSKGYKLLNVIVTRAKYKVYVCTSIPESVFMNYKDYLVTEGSNNKRAVLFAYLAYAKAVSEKNEESRISVLTSLAENSSNASGYDDFLGHNLESPFEEEVFQRLVDELGSQHLIPQLKVSEFRIDIVYDSKIPGVPKIAIECDGAKYHSSREAYLHDTHRQKILENHGFVFHRIWSTNWWDNPTRETAKLVRFIREIEAQPLAITDNNLSETFKDL